MHAVDDVQAFPEGSRVLHIGPPKTGTTVVQSALHSSRAAMAEYSVEYAASKRHPRAAAAAVSFDKVPAGYRSDIRSQWDNLAHDFRSSTASRVILSSETLSNASDEQAAGIVKDLGGGENLKVVLTLRPLAALLSSRWQQFVQDFMVMPYPKWLEKVFAEGAEDRLGTDRFWRRYRLDEHIRRWGSLVGEENLTFIVLDPPDRDMLLHTFDRLLGMPEGTLVADRADRNLSLPYPEVEMIRRFNKRFIAEGNSRSYYVRSVRMHSLPQMKRVDAVTEQKYPIETPAWAVARSNELSERMNEAIRASDAMVIGDLDRLIQTNPAPDAPQALPETMSVESAAELAYAMFVGAQNYIPLPDDERDEGSPARPPAPKPTLESFSGAELVHELRRRAARKVRRG
jgi:hypothetical protein